MGYGKALLQHLAQICVERGYPRLDWWVLDWNPSSSRSTDASAPIGMDEWTVNRLTGPALERLASGDFNDAATPKRSSGQSSPPVHPDIRSAQPVPSSG